MVNSYLKIFVDCLEKCQKLNDTEFGRLIRAALHYKANGEEVKLTGREELLWDGMKLDIDRDNKKYAEIVKINSENGKKGGRPKKATKSRKKRTVFEETERSQDEDKDKDENKDKYHIDADASVHEQNIIDVINYLNLKAGKKYSSQVDKNKEHISGRLNDGRTVEELKYVIDVKCEEWLENAEFNKNLNPVTLFRLSNFDRYINQVMQNPAVSAYNQIAKEDDYRQWQNSSF